MTETGTTSFSMSCHNVKHWGHTACVYAYLFKQKGNAACPSCSLSSRPVLSDRTYAPFFPCEWIHNKGEWSCQYKAQQGFCYIGPLQSHGDYSHYFETINGKPRVVDKYNASKEHKDVIICLFFAVSVNMHRFVFGFGSHVLYQGQVYDLASWWTPNETK